MRPNQGRKVRKDSLMSNTLRFLAAAALALSTLPAQAMFHLFAIEQVYSNADGSIQFVVLHESSQQNGENFLQGHTLVASGTNGNTTKTFMFPANLPSGSTGGKRVLIATQSFASLGLVTPDYIVPDRFLATDGGTISYAEGVSQVAYNTLPTDGTNALVNGSPTPNVATNFAGQSAMVPQMAVTSVEFYNAMLDHYFISSLAPDIDALDTGRIGGWSRTGLSFFVYPSQLGNGAAASPVCRILIPPPANSHFFSASPQECADTLAKFPFMIKETDDAFFIALPQTTGMNAGACPANTIPVYRVFNNRPDGNHRYSTDPAIRDQMVARGGIAEGYGPNAVIMCAPATATS